MMLPLTFKTHPVAQQQALCRYLLISKVPYQELDLGTFDRYQPRYGFGNMQTKDKFPRHSGNAKCGRIRFLVILLIIYYLNVLLLLCVQFIDAFDPQQQHVNASQGCWNVDSSLVKLLLDHQIDLKLMLWDLALVKPI